MVAPLSFGAIVDEVFVERGGSPLHFFVEHFALAWPGGLEGLRLPSLLFFLLALPAAALVARELVGPTAAFFTTLALALAPLAVKLATFGRMYTLFLALLLWVAWAALRTAQSRRIALWALVGLLAGSLVYVHPVAPLYAGLALLAALVHSELGVARLVAGASAAAAAFVLAGLPYYVHSVTVLRERYDVERGSGRLATTAGRSIPEESLFVLTPDGLAVAVAFAALALAGLASLLFRRRRSAVALGVWVAVPVLFFSLVPVGGTRFFDRYLLAALPAFLLLVVTGCLAVARLVPRGALLAGLLLAGVLGSQAWDAAQRLAGLRALGLPRLVDAVARHEGDAVVFSSAGTPIAGRPPGLLTRYVALELPEVETVQERAEGELAAFLAGPREPRIGIWVFRGERERVEIARARLRGVDGVVAERISPLLLLVRSAEARDPRALVELAYRVRKAWSLDDRSDRGVKALLAIDRKALEAQSRRK